MTQGAIIHGDGSFRIDNSDIELLMMTNEANAAQHHDADLVWWDGEQDPANPYNWPIWKKVVNCALISVETFVVAMASSMFAPSVAQLMTEFKSTNSALGGFVVSVYVLGFAFGPLIIAPMSEIYGRSPVYHVCNVGYVAFTIGCATAPSLNSLIGFRLLAGIFGSCPLSNASGSVADMFAQEQRAAAVAATAVGPILGPIIGPVAGSFLGDAKGWRWVFWVITIISGAVTIAMIAFLRESYAPVILKRKTDRLRKNNPNKAICSKLDSGLSSWEHIKRDISRPLKMLAFSPIVLVFAVYMMLVYGYMYLLFTTITDVFENDYGFSSNIVGLVYLGLGVGSILGLAFGTVVSNRSIKKQVGSTRGVVKPEVRLTMLPVGAVFLPAGLFLYGWSAEYHTHWIVPIIGTGFFGFGNLLSFLVTNLYLVDSFDTYSASALAANTVMRSICGACLPLAGTDMYNTLGLGWGNSLLGFIAVAFIPVPFLLIRYGQRLRERFEIKNL